MKRFVLFVVVMFCGVFAFVDRLSDAIIAGDIQKVKSCIEGQGVDVNRINVNRNR